MTERPLSERMQGRLYWVETPEEFQAYVDEAAALEAENARLRDQRDGAYQERDRLVAVLSKVFPSHLCRHEGSDWEDDWRNIICIHFPTGQGTWHIHDSELPMFSHLPMKPSDYDGHSTEQKYRRLEAMRYE